MNSIRDGAVHAELKLDAGLPPIPLAEVGEIAAAAEGVGFHTLWSNETQHDPFLPLAVAAEHTKRMKLGTAVAIAFARSPGVVAYTAWDLAQVSGGRFILGLGTQVKPHIERRFGLIWPESPAGKLREFVTAVRALWNTWQTGEKLNMRGDTLRLNLMSPFFNPGPIDHPRIPIYLAGVNPGMGRLSGEIADGFHAHPLHTQAYLKEVIRPALDAGAERAARDPNEIALAASIFTVTSESEADIVRSQIAFYASTPSYRRVFELHGWEAVAEELSGMARNQAWGEMAGRISDEMLETCAVVAAPQDLPREIKSRYAGLAQRVIPYMPYYPGTQDEFWAGLVKGMGES
jgi:probable F420-dependent oxidoreductase